VPVRLLVSPWLMARRCCLARLRLRRRRMRWSASRGHIRARPCRLAQSPSRFPEPEAPLACHDAEVSGAALQLATAGLGVAGTLTAALCTQALARKAEQDRRRADDASRWLAERLKVNSRLLAEGLALEREIWDLCSFLDRDEREERLSGHTSLYMTPESGIPGIVDEEARTILVNGLHGIDERLGDLEKVVAEISLIGSPSESLAARSYLNALWDTYGWLESYSLFDVAADAVEKCRALRDQFTSAARESLRVEGKFVAYDERPRLSSDSDA
jgi:hypothetical protein